MVTSREHLERQAAGGDEAAALTLADALDAEGRHTDAIDALARAARGGSAAAMARVGARIIIGDRAPALPVQGAGLIEDAAHAGDAEAAALFAVLIGAGAYRRQSWSEALDWLQRAAERGHASARRQLALLASDPQLKDEARAAGNEAAPDLWARLRAGVDVAALLAPPPGETLSADPLLRRFEGFAAPETCDWLVTRARERLRRAEVYDQRARSAVSEVRTNSTRIFSLVETDLVQLFLQARIAATVGRPFSHMEASAVLHYAVGERFDEHFDFIDPDTPNYAQHLARSGQREVTFLVYLNDGYEGGETAFPRLGINHKGTRGEGLLLTNALPSGDPDERTLHAGRPPTKGEKWILSQFIRSRPVVPGA